MRAFLVVALLLISSVIRAQVPDTLRAEEGERVLPVEIAREVVALYNAPAALRAIGPATIGAEQIVEGDVAVLNGPLSVRGQVRGRVVVVNGNLLLAPSARIRGDVIVVGGAISGLTTAQIEGQLRWHPQPLRYVRDGERIALDPGRPEVSDIIDWRPWPRGDDQWRSRILITSGGIYNRVEGLPILAGPSLRFSSGMTRVSLDVLGIMRSADGFRWDRDNRGHDVDGRVRFGDTRALSIGAQLFDLVRPVEEWQLRDSETSLAAFLVRRDYRDYYNSHGAGVSLGLHAGRALDLEIGFARERWRSREARDPFTLFRQGAVWRANAAMDEGRFNVTSARLTADTRNEPVHPRSGWLITADLEHGSSSAAALRVPVDNGADPSVIVRPLDYTRVFLDMRRYNRVSPHGQVNLRLVLGGWLAGDDLPLERRLSVGGAGTLPGYNFRDAVREDVFTCGGASLPGTPALCERVALAQVEYRGDLRLHWARDRGIWSFAIDRPAAWVVFANSGRGWLVDESTPDVPAYAAGRLPPLSTFRTDIGGGLDLGWLGFFVAKSVTDGEEPANFFIRLRHRF